MLLSQCQYTARSEGPRAKWCCGNFSLELSQWVPRHEKSTRRLSAMSPRMTLLAESNMAAVGHDENQGFLKSIYPFNTSKSTNVYVWNSIRILICPFGVIFTLKGHDQGHFVIVTSQTLVITWPFVAVETKQVIPLIQLILKCTIHL